MKISQYLIDEGYVVKKKHPTEELYLYNYTPKAQFEGINSPVWKDYPEMQWCRGLILNDKDEVVARPFPKFWNIESYENDGLPPYNSFEIYDKLDGSLGIVYPTSKGIAVATRGSFESEQALWATKFLNEKYYHFCKDHINSACTKYTVLFEIIYPENRIVVDYKGENKLVLLSLMGNNGLEISRETVEIFNIHYKFPIVEKFDGISDFRQVRTIIERQNAEGFVVLFDNGLRVKMKYEEYCRLHKLITGVSSKKIWEILRGGGSFDEILSLVPDEFYDWVTKVKNDLESKHKTIRIEVELAMERLDKLIDVRFKDVEVLDAKEVRKALAIYIMQNYKPIASILFSRLDNKMEQVNDGIWKMIEPKYEQPFKTGVETE